MNRIQQLHQLGQSIWLDFIERTMIQRGELQALVDKGVAGVTSNPTIFQQAIAKSDAYQDDLRRLAATTDDAKTIFEGLAIADIQAAADVMRPVYDANQGHDGFVSLEVAPDLAYDTAATIAEARRLHAAVARPNLMVKVPATQAGIPAIRQLIADGININVTLIFSLDRYAEVKEAFIQGLETRLEAGLPIDRIASVASFFVSRVDVNIDGQLDKLAAQHPDRAARYKALQGKAAVANAKLAYAQFEEKFAGARWEALAAAGARVQRPLWASTSTKNPNYPDLLYVDPLIGPHTVNTMPPQTLDALQDHGVAACTVTQEVAAARQTLAALAEAGIVMDEVTAALEKEGVKKFADSFVELLDVIEERRKALASA
ncbi:transaldolase [Caldilinea sp.]|uniref:transaldolase n=1 Tax=Caldilinea sp. TaxID=2293560 RepID=UPI002CBB1C3C|nr:transaldolase [Caldilinea sp.]